MGIIVAAVLLSCIWLVLSTVCRRFLTPPPTLPKNLPTIPFYYALLPLVKDIDQEQLYRKYLEKPLNKYGAVKIFFGGRWNILITRPSYISEVFKYEDIYAKSGNQKKIPSGVLAQYTGDNIISSHGENWKLYTSVIKPSLQQDYDEAQLYRNTRTLISKFLAEQTQSDNRSVMVVTLLQRYTLANLSQVLLGSDFETLERPDAPLSELQTLIKPKIFNPFFLNFPFLDRFKLRSREEARKLVQKFQQELCATVRRGHQHKDCSLNVNSLGCRMITASESNLWTEQQFKHNMVSVFLAGHENPQLLLTSMMFLLGEHTDIQSRLRNDLMRLTEAEPSTALQDVPFFTAAIYETLRMYPPISQLINRCTTGDVILGDDIHIPAGTYVGYNGFSSNRDQAFWGPSADEFRPERWGSTNEEINALYRRANSKGAFISFHGGRRACLGQKFAMFEARVTMSEILRSVKWIVDPEWPRRMTSAGPLYARMLRLKFEKL
ncbi:Dit2 protein [Rhizodiscina lignyota]|uniref:Dit2 protein n=1 Tax=Rhizodiscina lignyota TaxID=1504668 RepID=A0A9P4INJ7_9PEZI|nr:Dit2 protein [Rhizodiscina lignyota]